MTRFDWVKLVFNGFWVLGAAVMLAAFSFACYEAHRRGERLRLWITDPGYRLCLLVGLVLIGLGMTLIGPHWLERALWGAFLFASAWQLWATWRCWRTGSD